MNGGEAICYKYQQSILIRILAFSIQILKN